LAGCSVPSVPSREAKSAERIATPEAKAACAAVEQALLVKHHAPEGTTFGHCDAMKGERADDYTVAVAINLPHRDENGIYKLDTFYYATVARDPATNEMRATSLTSN
jgi:hypothetical protein